MKKHSVLKQQRKVPTQSIIQTGSKIDWSRSPTSLDNKPFYKMGSTNLDSVITLPQLSTMLYNLLKEEIGGAIKEILIDCIPQIIPELIRKEEERLITSSEAKELLSISQTTLWRWDKNGLIQSVGTGKHKRYKYNSILKYLDGL